MFSYRSLFVLIGFPLTPVMSRSLFGRRWGSGSPVVRAAQTMVPLVGIERPHGLRLSGSREQDQLPGAVTDVAFQGRYGTHRCVASAAVQSLSVTVTVSSGDA